MTQSIEERIRELQTWLNENPLPTLRSYTDGLRTAKQDEIYFLKKLLTCGLRLEAMLQGILTLTEGQP